MLARMIIAAWALALAALPATAQEKKKVEKAADLPRFSYRIEGKIEDTVRDDSRFAAFAKAFRRDSESVLAGYDIQDKATLRQTIGTLAVLDFLENRPDEALARLAQFKFR